MRLVVFGHNDWWTWEGQGFSMRNAALIRELAGRDEVGQISIVDSPRFRGRTHRPVERRHEDTSPVAARVTAVRYGYSLPLPATWRYGRRLNEKLAHGTLLRRLATASRASEAVWSSEGRLNVVNNTTGNMMEALAGSRCFVSGSAGEAGRRELRTNMMLPDRRLLLSAGAEFERRFFAGAWRPRFARAELQAVFGANGYDLYAAALERVTGAVRAGDGLPAADRLDLFLSGPAEAINRTRLRLSSRWVTARASFLARRWSRGLFSGAPAERIDDLPRPRLVRHLDPALAHLPWTQTRLSLPLSEPILLGLRAVSSGLARLPEPRGADAGDASPSDAMRSSGEPFSAICARARQLIYPYSIDLETWMRTGSRSFVESVLFSGQARARGLTLQAGVLQMWREQLAGGHHARAVGALLTLELWCRVFLDGEGSGS